MKNNNKTYLRSSMPISLPAMRVFLVGLPVIIAELMVVTAFFWRDRGRDAVYALHRYPPMLEHIMLSLTLLVIGAFLFDYLARCGSSPDK